jgi:hypothetical protein
MILILIKMIQKMFVNTAEGQGKAIISNEKTRLARRSNLDFLVLFIIHIINSLFRYKNIGNYGIKILFCFK